VFICISRVFRHIIYIVSKGGLYFVIDFLNWRSAKWCSTCRQGVCGVIRRQIHLMVLESVDLSEHPFRTKRTYHIHPQLGTISYHQQKSLKTPYPSPELDNCCWSLGGITPIPNPCQTPLLHVRLSFSMFPVVLCASRYWQYTCMYTTYAHTYDTDINIRSSAL
jgi:hypothetical protein